MQLLALQNEFTLFNMNFDQHHIFLKHLHNILRPTCQVV